MDDLGIPLKWMKTGGTRIQMETLECDSNLFMAKMTMMINNQLSSGVF